MLRLFLFLAVGYLGACAAHSGQLSPAATRLSALIFTSKAVFTIPLPEDHGPVARLLWVLSWNHGPPPRWGMGAFGLWVGDALPDSILLPMATRLDHLTHDYYWLEEAGSITAIVSGRVSRRASEDDPWGDPVNLGSVVNSPAGDCSPALSQDGLLLFFTSGRTGAGGAGLNDIYMASRTDPADDLSWSAPVPLGPEVNTGAYESSPFVTRWYDDDGTAELYFDRGASNSAGNDIYVVTIDALGVATGPATAVAEVNSAASDVMSTVGFDGREMLLSSNRGVGYDLFVATRQSRNYPWPGCRVEAPRSTGEVRFLVERGAGLFRFTLPLTWVSWHRRIGHEECRASGVKRPVYSGRRCAGAILCHQGDLQDVEIQRLVGHHPLQAPILALQVTGLFLLVQLVSQSPLPGAVASGGSCPAGA